MSSRGFEEEGFIAPLFDALVRHAASRPIPFHVPGHKMGKGLPPRFLSWMGAAARLDLTEIEGLDDLHHPAGVIAQAEDLAAQTFGADHSFFLVGGSTCGNIAMLLAACQPGDTVIVARNAHQSIWHAISLARLRVAWVMPEHFAPPFDAPSFVSCDAIRLALRAHPHAKAVVVTSPTYHGIASPLRDIADVVHDAGMLLLVDEAHGAHLRFLEGGPEPALDQGADAAVQSTHKTLGSLTQTAMLHLRGGRLSAARVRRALRFIESSSPSYLLLASLDATRAHMAENGRRLWHDARRTVETLRGRLVEVGALVFGEEPHETDVLFDPTKVWLAVEGLSGSELAHELRTSHGIHVELVDAASALLVWTFADSGAAAEKLVRAVHAAREVGLARIAATGEFAGPSSYGEPPAVARSKFPPWPGGSTLPSAHLQDVEGEVWVRLDEAEGRAAADFVVPYPPGIPLIGPGERFTRGVVEWLRAAWEQNMPVRGVDAQARTVCVAVSGKGE